MNNRKDTLKSQKEIQKRIEMQYKQPDEKKERMSISKEIKKFLVTQHVTSLPPKREKRNTEQLRICSLCKTTQTSLWRRLGNLLVCNACGLYYRIHGKPRDPNKKDKKGMYTENNENYGSAPQAQ
ncbi:hypothetical protein NEFER03_1399 [Nematocida sp. LUAm3]|nr:hypothetical protein NEFER03_1399 [Nematocida sp. LUAm3]KAI5174771.1 hypothetical protein NEFER02_0881 [Nematocida sp. LUAm2]KAI5177818.1 hypothetical protein NEFER01_1020 [Nematocida sp. LUAm1]